MPYVERKHINHRAIAVGFTQLIVPQLESDQKLSESVFMVRRYATLRDMLRLDGTSTPFQVDRT